MDMQQPRIPAESKVDPKTAPLEESRGLLLFTAFLLVVLWLLVLGAHL